MTNTVTKVKFNFLAFLCYTLSVVLLWTCYCVYAYLPLSDEFTNSIEVSGKETVYAFGGSFAAGILSTLIFFVMAYAFRKYFYKLSLSDGKIGKLKFKDATVEWISLVSSVLIFAMLCTATVLSFLYFKNCLFDMPEPFLAPTDGTVYKTYEYVIFGISIAHTVVYVLTFIKMLNIHWLDAIACFVGRVIGKIKKCKKTKR